MIPPVRGMKQITIGHLSARAVFGVAFFASALAILATFAMLGGNASAASSGEYQYGGGEYGGGKVTICHHTGSKKHPTETITVSENALPAHLAHGDTLGRCPDGS
ncbi:MAG: hypothetical protein QOD08_555 [Gaiellaceae bacterium]|nr:hypothetical protein [Gaiellaceae bacterium]